MSRCILCILLRDKCAGVFDILEISLRKDPENKTVMSVGVPVCPEHEGKVPLVAVGVPGTVPEVTLYDETVNFFEAPAALKNEPCASCGHEDQEHDAGALGLACGACECLRFESRSERQAEVVRAVPSTIPHASKWAVGGNKE